MTWKRCLRQESGTYLTHPGLEHGSFQGTEFSLEDWFNDYVSSVYILYLLIIPKWVWMSQGIPT